MSEKRKRQGELDIEVDNDTSNSNASKEKGSNVWNHFDKFKGDDGITRAKCRHCDKGLYNMSNANNSTGNLIKHLKLHPDKTDPSTKKQAKFMVEFLNNNSSQIVNIYIYTLFFLLIYVIIKFTYLNKCFVGIF
jgi:BED zinc finger